MMIISLCGFMGAGKSTIGKNLARDIGYKFIDLDSYLENKLGITVTEIFEKIGEDGFRNQEYLALQEIITEAEKHLISINQKEESALLDKHGLVIALGGGTVTNSRCATLVKEKTFCIYLNCPKELLIKRLLKNNAKRPLVAGRSQTELDTFITNLMVSREPVYKDCARYICNIDLQTSPVAVINNITEFFAR